MNKRKYIQVTIGDENGVMLTPGAVDIISREWTGQTGAGIEGGSMDIPADQLAEFRRWLADRSGYRIIATN